MTSIVDDAIALAVFTSWFAIGTGIAYAVTGDDQWLSFCVVFLVTAGLPLLLALCQLWRERREHKEKSRQIKEYRRRKEEGNCSGT